MASCLLLSITEVEGGVCREDAISTGKTRLLDELARDCVVRSSILLSSLFSNRPTQIVLFVAERINSDPMILLMVSDD